MNFYRHQSQYPLRQVYQYPLRIINTLYSVLLSQKNVFFFEHHFCCKSNFVSEITQLWSKWSENCTHPKLEHLNDWKKPKKNYDAKFLKLSCPLEKFLARNNAEIKSMNHTIHLIQFSSLSLPFFRFFQLLAKRSTNPLYRYDHLFLFIFQTVDAFYLLKTFWVKCRMCIIVLCCTIEVSGETISRVFSCWVWVYVFVFTMTLIAYCSSLFMKNLFPLNLGYTIFHSMILLQNWEFM